MGIRPVTGFILGYPFETRRTLSDTLRRFFEYLEVGGFRAHLFTLSPFPESPMYRQFGVPHLDRPAEYYDLPLTPAGGGGRPEPEKGSPERLRQHLPLPDAGGARPAGGCERRAFGLRVDAPFALAPPAQAL